MKLCTWKVTHPLPAAAAVKIDVSSSSSSSLLYIKRSCLLEQRSDDVVVTLAKIDDGPAFFSQLSRGPLFHLRIFRDVCARSWIIGRYSIPRRDRDEMKLHADDKRTSRMDGEGETNREAARAKSRRRLARFRVSDPSDNRPAPSALYRTPFPPTVPRITNSRGHLPLCANSRCDSRALFCRKIINFPRTWLIFYFSMDTLFDATKRPEMNEWNCYWWEALMLYI